MTKFINEFFDWINKDLNYILTKESYQYFFEDVKLDEEEDDTFYLSNYAKGIELVLSKDKIVESIHLFGVEMTDQKQFEYELPLNIHFSFTRENIIGVLGKPPRHGGGYKDIHAGFINTCDKYYFSTYSLRFEYSQDEKWIVLITIGSLALEDVLNINLQ